MKNLSVPAAVLFAFWALDLGDKELLCERVAVDGEVKWLPVS